VIPSIPSIESQYDSRGVLMWMHAGRAMSRLALRMDVLQVLIRLAFIMYASACHVACACAGRCVLASSAVDQGTKPALPCVVSRVHSPEHLCC